MRKSTMTDLVVELEKLSDTPTKESLIQLARQGEFHDYRSPQICGKVYFVHIVDNILKSKLEPESDNQILKRLSDEIKDGVYDEPYTQEDKAHVLKELEGEKYLSDKDKALFKLIMGL